ncbi:unnamed protein product [Heterobilharzia americana]|nr:unnamed protein product [Heterobilharzia americana]
MTLLSPFSSKSSLNTLGFHEKYVFEYEEKVDAFLRGIGSRPRAGGYDHNYSRSPSRSCSYSPPYPHGRHREYYRGSSSYSRSRSPSGRNIPLSKDRRAELDSDSYRHRPPPYISPRHRERTNSRSPRNFAREPPAQCRRPLQTSVAHSGVKQRHQQVDGRGPSHQDRLSVEGREHTVQAAVIINSLIMYMQSMMGVQCLQFVLIYVQKTV